MFAAVVLATLLSAQGAKVYHGTVQGAKKPAEVTASRIFDQIPEYQKIKEKGLTSEDAEYFILLTKANMKFYAAVSRAASTATCDVVIEKGTGTFVGEVSDLTQKTIEAIEK